MTGNGAAADAAVHLRSARTARLARPELVGRALRDALTDVADEWLGERLDGAADVALVAVGGYGRREPAPGSDLDLLLLHQPGVAVGALADALWYPIWDAGVGLDHSVRTVPEAVTVARDDLKVAMGLLDARHVAGDPELTQQLRERVLADWRRDAGRRLPELVESVRARAQRVGELAFLLEPDLKESRGGLRDVVAVRAIAAAWVADAPDERVQQANAWLLDVRGELHRGSGRGSDRLVAQEQGRVAAALGASDADDLMRQVYDAGRAIAYALDDSCRRAEVASRPVRRRDRRAALVRRPLADGVVEQAGEVHLARDADPVRDPVLLLRVTAAAAQAALPISAFTLRRLAEQGAPMPDPWPPAARAALVSALGAGPAVIPVFEALDQAGLLTRLLPEWDRVRCKPQHNPVHRFTVDRHLIETAAAAAGLMRRVGRPDLLLLGALLHDIGKGYPGDHTVAGIEAVPAIATRWGLGAGDVATLTALVRHHLLLPDTATRRDLADPATVELTAEAVGDRSTLELLHALTEADAAATGPAAWSDWKAGLVRELVDRTAAALAGAPQPAPVPLDRAQVELAERGDVALELFGSRITIVAPDRPGLLCRWAGVLALHRLEIRSAAATSVTGPDGVMAVTVFEVAPRFGSSPEVEVLRQDVRVAYEGDLPITDRLAAREQTYADSAAASAAPPRVLWVDDASRSATVVEVRAHDRVGLLYRLTHVLADEGIDVRSARIATLGAEAVDTFYLVDRDGQLLTSSSGRDRLEQRLLVAADGGAVSDDRPGGS